MPVGGIEEETPLKDAGFERIRVGWHWFTVTWVEIKKSWRKGTGENREESLQSFFTLFPLFPPVEILCGCCLFRFRALGSGRGAAQLLALIGDQLEQRFLRVGEFFDTFRHEDFL